MIYNFGMLRLEQKVYQQVKLYMYVLLYICLSVCAYIFVLCSCISACVWTLVQRTCLWMCITVWMTMYLSKNGRSSVCVIKCQVAFKYPPGREPPGLRWSGKFSFNHSLTRATSTTQTCHYNLALFQQAPWRSKGGKGWMGEGEGQTGCCWFTGVL